MRGMEDDRDMSPAHALAAAEKLRRVIKLLADEPNRPTALLALHGIIGAAILRHSETTLGELLDEVVLYADDERLAEAVGDMLTEEGVLQALADIAN